MVGQADAPLAIDELFDMFLGPVTTSLASARYDMLSPFWYHCLLVHIELFAGMVDGQLQCPQKAQTSDVFEFYALFQLVCWYRQAFGIYFPLFSLAQILLFLTLES